MRASARSRSERAAALAGLAVQLLLAGCSASRPACRPLTTTLSDLRQHLLVVQAGVGYLSKAFSPDQLAARVRSALDAPEPARGGTTSRGDPP